MDLLERYLQAVKFWLPKEQKQDIIAELSEDIHSQMDEKESQLGRKLNEAEVEAILRQCGRPVLVANRYLPQEYLIGPVLFPIYSFVLKIVSLCWLVPGILISITLMLLSPEYRAAHNGDEWLGALLSVLSWLWSTAFLAVGVTTLVFAVLERVQAQSRFLENWSPRKLPPLRSPNHIQYSASVLELAANFVFIVWWTTNMSALVILDRPQVKISLSPAWHYFFWGFLCLAIFNLALSAVNLARPYWTTVRATLRLVSDLVGAALFCSLLKVGILLELRLADVTAERSLETTNTINLWMGRAFPVAVAFCVVIALANLYRIFRVRARRPSTSEGIAAAAV